MEIEKVDIPVASDGINLKASIYFNSETPSKAPFIINCPALYEHRESKFVKSFTESFVEAGYYVLVYDYRGHGETANQSRKKWGRLLREIFSDIHIVISWVTENQSSRLLKNKIALFGRSFGAAIILTQGFIDKRAKILISLCARYDYSSTTVKFSDENIKLMSPKYYLKIAESNNKRILIAHCKDDERIPFENLTFIQEHLGLKEENVIKFETGGHSFRGHRDEIFNISLDFLKKI